MITEQTLRAAAQAAAELRDRGAHDRAAAVEALVRAAADEMVPSLDLLTSTQAGELLGVTGQTIKNWVRSARITGFRVGGRIMVPREAVAEYVSRARGSLDLPSISDDEAAHLVAESRARPQ